MNPEEVEELQERFPGSSWAIWSERFPADGCVEEDTSQLTKFIHTNCDS